jgi:dihydropteroate synthase-like protein
MPESERLLFLTGRLALPRLEKAVQQIDFGGHSWRIANMGVKVAALMNEALIKRRLSGPLQADRVIIPGRCRVDVDALSAHFGTRFERGPEEVKDLPRYFGKQGQAPDLSRHDTRIFAEIVDAPLMSIAAILERAKAMRRAGADVIDLGCSPGEPFPHMEEAIAALKASRALVSVDSADEGELRRGALAGADYLLSLNERRLHLVEGTDATPVLIPEPQDNIASLIRAADAMEKQGRPYICDPVLDPIHHGFAASLVRYAEFRRLRPNAEMLMGTGNLTELTDADSGGVTAILMGLASELGVRNVLTVHVSEHTRRTIQEHDIARRLMFAARADASMPRDYTDALLVVHERAPFAATPTEVAELGAQVRDANFHIEVTEDGIHVFNRAMYLTERDPFAFFPKLGVETDGGHAFYLGVELARAEIAWQLGKRYVQTAGLRWGVAVDAQSDDTMQGE